MRSDPRGREFWDEGLQAPDCWDRGFEKCVV